ncbi:hypothetical protein CBM2615_B100064 [Cupriavidus taiwanensis]|nr:hypothetical protein CBM2615_B100064 [Cupriavidus taiwanensis]
MPAWCRERRDAWPSAQPGAGPDRFRECAAHGAVRQVPALHPGQPRVRHGLPQPQCIGRPADSVGAAMQQRHRQAVRGDAARRAQQRGLAQPGAVAQVVRLDAVLAYRGQPLARRLTASLCNAAQAEPLQLEPAPRCRGVPFLNSRSTLQQSGHRQQPGAPLGQPLARRRDAAQQAAAGARRKQAQHVVAPGQEGAAQHQRRDRMRIARGVGQRQRRAPRSPDHAPAGDAQRRAQLFQVGQQRADVVAAQAAGGGRAAGAALVGHHHAVPLRVEPGGHRRGTAAARPAMQDQPGLSARRADQPHVQALRVGRAQVEDGVIQGCVGHGCCLSGHCGTGIAADSLPCRDANH